MRKPGKVGVAQRIRAHALGVIRLLLVAFALQAVAPLVDGGAPVAFSGDGGDRIQICTSSGIHYIFLHDGQGDTSRAPLKAHGEWCAFCLPLIAGHMVMADAAALATPMGSFAAIAPPTAADIAPGQYRSNIRSRAPPLPSMTV